MRTNLQLLLWAGLSILVTVAPAKALTSSEILSSLQASKALTPGVSTDIWLVGTTAIVTTSSQLVSQDAALAQQATSLSHCIFSCSPGTIKQAIIIFTDGRDGSKSYKAFSVDAAQDADIDRQEKAGQAATPVGPVLTGDRASTFLTAAITTTTTRSTPTGSTESAASAAASALLAKRSALMVRIKYLQGRGVGVRPYLDQMTQIDQRTRESGPEAGAVALGQLDRLVADQEKAINTRAQAVSAATAAGQAAAAGGDADVEALLHSMKDFNGSSKDYQQSLKHALMQKEFGDLTVMSGPFVVERARIAKRIRELETQGRNMTGYKNMFRETEALIDTKDPRKTGEVASNVKYLQSQLGLSDFK